MRAPGSLALKLWMVVSLRMGGGNWTQVLGKSNEWLAKPCLQPPNSLFVVHKVVPSHPLKSVGHTDSESYLPCSQRPCQTEGSTIISYWHL